MIVKDQMMGLILEACPSFRSEWEQFLAEWRDEKDLPLYLAMSNLVRHVITAYEQNDLSIVKNAFAVVERWHIDGDWEVKEIATIGFLEDMQNGNLHGKTTPKDFEQFLGSESLRWWKKVNEFWDTGKIITDD